MARFAASVNFNSVLSGLHGRQGRRGATLEMNNSETSRLWSLTPQVASMPPVAPLPTLHSLGAPAITPHQSYTQDVVCHGLASFA